MGKGKQPVVKRMRRAGFASEPTPKPCPTCYAPMRMLAKDVFECDRHGAPTRR